MAKSKKGKVTAGGWIVGAAGVGLGAGIALERLLIGRTRIKKDPYSEERYGRISPDRKYQVKCSDGASISVYESGPETGPALVFLHGLALDHSIWHHQLAELSSDTRCIYFDARKHGRSKGGGDPTDVTRLANDLNLVLEKADADEVILVGHSMGGMTVLEYCRMHENDLKERVKGIVLINTTYTDALKTLMAAEIIGPIDRRLGWLFGILLDNPKAHNNLKLRGDDLSYLLVRLFGFGAKSSPTQVEHVRRLLAKFPSPELFDTIRGIRKFDMEDALESVDVPTVIIAGGDDRITTVRASEDMADRIPNARLTTLEDAGHITMMERHPEVTQQIRTLLKEVTG
ncbi:MAG TPA: alpha/beta hydrolase [Actinomycetota bacterium]|nr:alpha/beta hydrolase [Actinomycetota bacterium]